MRSLLLVPFALGCRGPDLLVAWNGFGLMELDDGCIAIVSFDTNIPPEGLEVTCREGHCLCEADDRPVATFEDPAFCAGWREALDGGGDLIDDAVADAVERCGGPA